MPDPRRLLTTLQRAAQAFRETPGRTGRVLRLPEGAEVLVVGDIHGNVDNFRSVFKLADFANQPRRHLVMQEVIHGPFAYPDEGGDKSHQMVDLLAALKLKYPERVHFLLGNHELAQWRKQRVAKGNVDQNDWFTLGVRTAYGDSAGEILDRYDDLFAAAELAIRAPNRVFLSPTVPPKASTFSLSILEAEVIADSEFRSGGAAHGIVWGRDVSQANVDDFLDRVDADLLISGHIPTHDGYIVPNNRQIILDSIGTPAGYCLFSTDDRLTQEQLIAKIGML